MSIEIIRRAPIHITEADHSRYHYEYQQSMSCRAGPIPTFEDWLRQKLAAGSAK